MDEGSVGVVADGAAADLIVVDGDPATDIACWATDAGSAT